MTSKIQQLLDSFMNYNPDEQQKCLEIVKKIHDIVKDESQRSEKDQQSEASNSNHQETLTTIQRIPENWKVLCQNKLSTEQSIENTEITQTVSLESEDQPSHNDFIKLQKAETSSKNKGKRKDIQCYNCTKKRHIMKDCPHSLKIIKSKNNGITHSYTCEIFRFHKERIRKVFLIFSTMNCLITSRKLIVLIVKVTIYVS